MTQYHGGRFEMRKEISNEKVNYSNISKNQAKREITKENFETEQVKKEPVKEEPVQKVKEKKEDQKSVKKAVVYNCEELNIRSTPDTNGSNVISVAKKGMSYNTSGTVINGFVEIEFNGGKAYAMAQYLDIK